MAAGPTDPMARRHPILRVFLILAVSAVGLLVLVAGLAVFGGLDERALFGNAVGVVDVRGVIEDGTDVIETLERFRRQDGTVAVVLRIDSPGGSALASDVLARELARTAQFKPVICSLGDVAASGGYFIAAGADRIYVGKASLVGWKSQVWVGKQIPGSRTEIFETEEGGNHFMFMENPEKFNRIVKEFMG